MIVLKRSPVGRVWRLVSCHDPSHALTHTQSGPQQANIIYWTLLLAHSTRISGGASSADSRWTQWSSCGREYLGPAAATSKKFSFLICWIERRCRVGGKDVGQGWEAWSPWWSSWCRDAPSSSSGAVERRWVGRGKQFLSFFGGGQKDFWVGKGETFLLSRLAGVRKTFG